MATPTGLLNWALVAGPLSAAEAFRPGARHGGDHSLRDLADEVVRGIGNIEVAGRVHRDACGVVQLSAGGRSVVAAEAFRPGVPATVEITPFETLRMRLFTLSAM